MKGSGKLGAARAVLGTTALALIMASSPAWADEPTNEELEARIEALEKALESVPQMQQELATLRKQINESNTRANNAEARAKAAETKAAEATRTAQSSGGRDGPLPDTKWHLAGYADAGAVFPSGGADDSFTSGHFNPVMHFQYKDLVMFEGELEIEIEDGDTEVALEYGAFSFLVHDNIVFVVGKFLSPIGQFQERLHPSWINKIGFAPAGFGHDGVQPGAEVGIQVRGGVPIGNRALFNYALFAGNGPRMGHEGGVAFEGFSGDDNQNKAFGGRLGFLPVPYLEIGGSYMKGKISGLHEEEEGAHTEGITTLHEDLEPTMANVRVLGADVAYTRGPWDVRFEFLDLVRDPINSFSDEEMEVVEFERLKMRTWYVQLAYRLSEISSSPVLQRFEPVIRYGEFKIWGSEELEEENAQKRFNVGLNYWFAPSIVGRVGYERRKFIHDGHVEKLWLMQAAYGF